MYFFIIKNQERVRKRHEADHRLYDDPDNLKRIAQRYEEEADNYTNTRDDIDLSTVSNEINPYAGVEDCKCWAIKVKEGAEKDVVLRLQNKFIQLYNTKSRLSIHSAFYSATRGYIYVEAENTTHVTAALNGLRDVYLYMKNGMSLVSVKDTPELLIIKNRTVPFPRDSFVRINYGDYKGDIGQIIDLIDDGKVFVKVIPRVDFDAVFEGRPQPKGMLPQQKFDAKKYQASTKRHQQLNRNLDFFGNKYYHNGFLFKDISLRYLSRATPTMEELEMFQNNNDDDAFSDSEEEENQVNNQQVIPSTPNV